MNTRRTSHDFLLMNSIIPILPEGKWGHLNFELHKVSTIVRLKFQFQCPDDIASVAIGRLATL